MFLSYANILRNLFAVMGYAWPLAVELQVCIHAPKHSDRVEEDRPKVLRKIFGRVGEEVTIVLGGWKNIVLIINQLNAQNLVLQ